MQKFVTERENVIAAMQIVVFYTMIIAVVTSLIWLALCKYFETCESDT